MLGYVTIGALDAEASGTFYDAVLGAIGDVRKFVDGGWIGYGPAAEGPDSHYCYVCPPFNKEPARAGNGIMIAFAAHSKDEVNAAHAAGLVNGGTDEGFCRRSNRYRAVIHSLYRWRSFRFPKFRPCRRHAWRRHLRCAF
jgi:hypothetical protein